MGKLSLISGWGRNKFVEAEIYNPLDNNDLINKVISSKKHSLISRGLGRSYGDSAQLEKKTVIQLPNSSSIELDIKGMRVTVDAGVSFDQLLKFIVPMGFFLPISPGTRFVTVGGAVAADVHGKNHHVDGSFGNKVQNIKIMDGNGEILDLNLSGNKENSEKFWATIGGMGMTGVILEVTFSLIPITSSLIKVDTQCFIDINDLMEKMKISDEKYRYSVAWIDSMHKSFRGVLTCGNHFSKKDFKKDSNKQGLSYNLRPKVKIPNYFPGGFLNKLTIKGFNSAWYRKHPKLRENELQDIGQYFYPLDAIANWNLVYGSSGFIQYQFAVPNESSKMIVLALETFKKISAPSFLTVLKRFGKSNQAPLSFPIEGWTLSIDIPAKVPNLLETLDTLDKQIISEGGRIYLAKDSRQNSEIFKAAYPRLNEWLNIREKMDPRNVFMSDSFKRLLS